MSGTLYGGPQSGTYQTTGQPTLADFLNLVNSNYRSVAGYPTKTHYAIAGSTGANEAYAMGKPAATYGYASLANMLANQGQIDPGLMNSQLRANDLGTQSQVAGTNAMFARNGLQNSGLAAALQAAQGQAGQNRAAQIRYQNASDAYARQQANLGLLNQLVVGPQVQYAGLNQGLAINSANQQAQQQGATTSALGAILAALVAA